MKRTSQRKVISFQIDLATAEELAKVAKASGGLSVGAFAREATLDRLMDETHLAQVVLEELKKLRIEGRIEREQIQTQISLATEVILKMLADSQIGGMNRDQVEDWICRKLPRPGRREH